MRVRLRREGRPRRGGIASVLLRRLPHDSCVHRLRIGTKLTAIAALTVATALDATWAQLIGVAVVVAVSLVAARVPGQAWPRLPIWFWVTLLIGFGLAAAGHGADRFLLFLGFALLFMVLSLVITWTTNLSDLQPALRGMGAPLRRIGLPVDDWALVAALSVRCLPLMLEECATVVAARRQRPMARHPMAIVRGVVDVVTACMAAAVRRGSDLGEVIAMRGGPGKPWRPAGALGVRDLFALVLIAAACALPAAVG